MRRILVAVLALVATVGAGPNAFASPPAPITAFYQPPVPLPPGAPGDVIRSEPSHLALSVPGGSGTFPANATRIMYRSTGATGLPNAVTGTVLDPSLPWRGPGVRPLVSFAIGTHGQGDQCAPSKLFNQVIQYNPPLDLMTEYEVVFIDLLLAQGIGVVVTDYDGLGTPAVHSYLNSAALAHAVIDAARAAQRVGGTSIPAHGPVAFWGYSEGGGAAAAAGEYAASYGPDLDVRGTFAGAAASPDLIAQAAKFDGTILSGFNGYLLNGLRAVYPQAAPVIDGFLNPAGRQLLAAAANQCAIETSLTYGFRRSSDMTVDHRSFAAHLADDPVTGSIVKSLHIGDRKPNAPVLLSTASADDIVPAEPIRATAAQWCGQGATVELLDLPTPPILPGTAIVHVIDSPLSIFGRSLAWLNESFDGVPARSTC
ncbi:lipase family protein [Antrihabitans cavernicola]|uniref:lipase family protein n=1 Tax=Antrihabitans cavernicola TaxID=2495913 RepID=UPI001F2ECB1E|nr:lipase family protein [Spelaeibacter cavernicola]